MTSSPPRDPQVIELADDDDFEKILEEEKYNGKYMLTPDCHVYCMQYSRNNIFERIYHA